MGPQTHDGVCTRTLQNGSLAALTALCTPAALASHTTPMPTLLHALQPPRHLLLQVAEDAAKALQSLQPGLKGPPKGGALKQLPKLPKLLQGKKEKEARRGGAS